MLLFPQIDGDKEGFVIRMLWIFGLDHAQGFEAPHRLQVFLSGAKRIAGHLGLIGSIIFRVHVTAVEGNAPTVDNPLISLYQHRHFATVTVGQGIVCRFGKSLSRLASGGKVARQIKVDMMRSTVVGDEAI
ncbi:hypothetical protein ASE61_25725 [Bosea sp. Root670]|nr:hypothetical protein ASE61_25725 [Bosea sp. Root670]